MSEYRPPESTSLVCLTVLVPIALEDRVVDWLLINTSGQTEFSVHAVAARGPLVHLAEEEEQVLGFAQRAELKLILDRRELDSLVQRLTQLLAGVDGGYWVLPVERFAPFVAQASTTQGAPA